MRRRTLYSLIGIIILFLGALIVDLAGTAGDFKVFGHGAAIRQGLDLQGGLSVLLTARNSKEVSDDSMNAALDVITKRVNAYGVSEPVVQRVGSNSIDVEVPGVKDPSQLRDTLGSTGQMVIYGMGTLPVLSAGATFPYTNTTKLCNSAGQPMPCIVVKGNELDPSQIAVSFDNVGQAQVNFGVKGDAVGRLSDYTTLNAGNKATMAIVLDGKVVTDPTTQSAITTGSGVINGIGSVDEANSISIQLKYGALPIAFDIAASNQVSATLGPTYVRASIVAGVVGLLVVMIFMLFYYRLPGLLADLALIVYTCVVFAVFKLLPPSGVTLTLAGIAGFILSIGMAVDANVLIFERLKEELRAGKTLGAAIEAGFARAWTSIRDSNISTMITCGVLYWFGQNFAASVIVGFATTLFLGVAISMFTAIVITRTFLRVIVRGNAAYNPAWFGAGLEAIARDRKSPRPSTQD
jgi:preprotein translocase subunit SecD